METNAVYARYQELQQYVGWTAADARRVHAALPLVKAHLAALVDDFYQEINRHDGARRVITGGQEQIDRLKGTLVAWLQQLFSGQYDQSYVARRWKVGWRHVEIGLNQVFTNVALSRLRDGLVQALHQAWTGDPRELSRTVRSLNKLLDLDLAIIEDAYQTEHLKRQQRIERLAAIGQISGGVAHELRNPLNVVKTSVYYLLNAKNPTPEKTAEHLRRIERQVDVADGVTTALSDFAKLPLPQLEPFDVEHCLREILEVTTIPENVKVSVDCDPELPYVQGDRRQFSIVFGNIIRNARDAMPDGGKLTITATHTDSNVEVAIADTGVGIQPEDLKQIHEPLYSTKARGIGLGLAITRAILEKHKTELDVQSQVGAGSIFTVKISGAVGR
jgi:signal transduction histidine kinase